MTVTHRMNPDTFAAILDLSTSYGGKIKKKVITMIKTHGSESRGQEEAGLRDERVSYLQVAPP